MFWRRNARRRDRDVTEDCTGGAAEKPQDRRLRPGRPIDRDDDADRASRDDLRESSCTPQLGRVPRRHAFPTPVQSDLLSRYFSAPFLFHPSKRTPATTLLWRGTTWHGSSVPINLA